MLVEDDDEEVDASHSGSLDVLQIARCERQAVHSGRRRHQSGGRAKSSSSPAAGDLQESLLERFARRARLQGLPEDLTVFGFRRFPVAGWPAPEIPDQLLLEVSNDQLSQRPPSAV